MEVIVSTKTYVVCNCCGIEVSDAIEGSVKGWKEYDLYIDSQGFASINLCSNCLENVSADFIIELMDTVLEANKEKDTKG